MHLKEGLRRVKARHPDMCNLPLQHAEQKVAERIANLRIDIAALQALAHSYRAKRRWAGRTEQERKDAEDTL